MGIYVWSGEHGWYIRLPKTEKVLYWGPKKPSVEELAEAIPRLEAWYGGVVDVKALRRQQVEAVRRAVRAGARIGTRNTPTQYVGVYVAPDLPDTWCRVSSGEAVEVGAVFFRKEEDARRFLATGELPDSWWPGLEKEVVL